MVSSPAKDVNVMSNNALIRPSELEARIPLTAKAEASVLAGRQQLEAVLNGEDERFAVIVGPCSIHDNQGALDYAERLKPLADQLSERLLVVMRVYFEKPRTTVGWKGLIYDPNLNDTYQIEDGLHRARQLLLEVAETGLYSATEFLDPIVPQYLSDLVTWAAIGGSHHREPDAPADGVGTVDAGRIQKRHRWRPSNGGGCAGGGQHAPGLPGD